MLLTAATLFGGCQSSSTATAKRPATEPTTMQWHVTPMPGQVVNLPVQQGRLPLAYLADVAGNARVVDMTDNRDLASSAVEARSIIAVADRGVWVGGNQLVGGPLADDHVYAIYFEAAGGPSELRRGTVGPSN